MNSKTCLRVMIHIKLHYQGNDAADKMSNSVQSNLKVCHQRPSLSRNIITARPPTYLHWRYVSFKVLFGYMLIHLHHRLECSATRHIPLMTKFYIKWYKIFYETLQQINSSRVGFGHGNII